MNKTNIKQIVFEQKGEIGEILHGRMIQRTIQPRFVEMFSTDLIKVVMGVRRCGKSILALQSLAGKSYGYVNFDDERLIGVKTSDLNHFLEAVKEIDPAATFLLLDEVQNVEGWELFVSRLKRKGYNVVVTGSNSKLLSRELATHLTGRHFSIDLYPFSFLEFLAYRQFTPDADGNYSTEQRAEIKRHLEEFLEFGGFPEVWRLDAKRMYLRELFDRIISRDIISRYGIKYVRDLKELALYAISNFSSRITYHKIRNLFDIKSVHTVKNYLHFLQEAYLLYQVESFSFKLKERLTGPRKIYCIDTGLINSIVPGMSGNKGRLMENVVFLELKRRGNEIYTYLNAKSEVDFLVREGLKVTQLIQVCFSLADPQTKKREMKALAKAAGELKCRDLSVITWDEEGGERLGTADVKFVPLWKWLLHADIPATNFRHVAKETP